MKASLGFTLMGGAIQCLNTFYVEDASDWIFANMATVATGIFTAATTRLVPVTYPAASYNLVILEDVRMPPFGGTSFPQTATPGTRAGTAGSLPTNAAIAITKVTSNLSRNGRGRWYFPLVDIASLSAVDTVQPAYVTLIVGALGNFATDVNGIHAGMAFGIVSYFVNNAVRGTGVFEAVTNFAARDGLVDTQRRRLAGRGR